MEILTYCESIKTQWQKTMSENYGKRQASIYQQFWGLQFLHIPVMFANELEKKHKYYKFACLLPMKHNIKTDQSKTQDLNIISKMVFVRCTWSNPKHEVYTIVARLLL